MDRNITSSPTFASAREFMTASLRVGSGQPYELSDLAVSPNERMVAAAGSVMDQLEGLPIQRIYLVDLETGELKQLTDGAQRDRLPRWDKAGSRIAYLSDSSSPYDFQLHVLTLSTAEVAIFPLTGHWVESLQWSPAGNRILLVAAGNGSDLAGAQGAITAPAGSSKVESLPDWSPVIDSEDVESHWRSAWLWDDATGKLQRISPPGINVWEACWCGEDAIACIASDTPGEEAWYSATVRKIAIGEHTVDTIFVSQDQLGWISASPSGRRIAFVHAACSDRMLVAGTLMVWDENWVKPVETYSVDVTFTAWQGEHDLLYAGCRSFETVLAHCDLELATARETWFSATRTFGSPLSPEAAPLRAPGSAVFVAEGHLTPLTLTLVTAEGLEECVLELSVISPQQAHRGATLTNLQWSSSDGLQIEGCLLKPPGPGPHPLILDVHGGPVWRSRPRYVGRGGFQGMLLRAGYAILQANPRGSSGRGQEYARAVFGDAGGADAQDLLAGLDRLVELGIADPLRIGVMGGSYGGYMAAWLITQDSRFAAAVPIAPVSDWTSLRLTSHVPDSIEVLMGGKPAGACDLYFARSPISHAHRVKTPALIICGELDRSTPPGQGVELHHALRRAGATSVLLTYPGEGHGVRRFPGAIDFVSRIVDWFQHHMPVRV